MIEHTLACGGDCLLIPGGFYITGTGYCHVEGAILNDVSILAGQGQLKVTPCQSVVSVVVLHGCIEDFVTCLI